MQNTLQYKSPMYDSSAFIPANYNFLNVELKTQQDTKTKLPIGQYIVPFKSHLLTMEKVIMEFLTQLNVKDMSINQFHLSLKCGTKIKKTDTVEDLRILLNRESASGITLVVLESNGMVDQACVHYYIQNNHDFIKEKINKLFILLHNKEPLYISARKDIIYDQLCQTIAKALNQHYKNQINPKEVTFYQLKKEVLDNQIDWSQVLQIQQGQLSKMIRASENEVIGIKITKQKCKWPKNLVNNQEFLIVHLKNNDKIKLKYSMLANYTIKQFLNYLNIQKSESFGIKIVDEIFFPHQFLKVVQKFFKTGDGKFVKNVECRLVSQREMFYYRMKDFHEQFNIQKDMVTKNSEGHFDFCRELARDRFKQNMKFNDYKEVSMITLYTSSVQVIDNQKNVVLYKDLNTHLRQKQFGMQPEYKSEWKYKYSASLIKSLDKVEKYGQNQYKNVYRGIKGHHLIGNVGEIYIEKQFCSTSYDPQGAKTFLYGCKMGTYLTIKCKSGRLIEKFSVFQHEKQVLFLPFTHFKILERKQPTQKDNILYMTLEQIIEPNYTSNPATYILWVDDKKQEGVNVITNLNCPMHTTFLRQLSSNSELQQWIHRSNTIIENPKISIAVITNMRRKEEDQDRKDAGAKTVKLVSQYIPNCKIIFYIGHIQGTKAALRNNDIDPSTVAIINQPSDLREFISHVTMPIEEEEGQSVVDQLNNSILHYFEDVI